MSGKTAAPALLLLCSSGSLKEGVDRWTSQEIEMKVAGAGKSCHLNGVFIEIIHIPENR